jgi:5-methylcytosine-specific restriction endonuclease McrA
MQCFVLNKKGDALMPCHPARARELLRKRRAVVHKRVPFVIRLKDRVQGATQPVRVKLDPGSKTTGIALVREEEKVDRQTGEVQRIAHVLWLGELEHRGQAIRDALSARSAFRRRRRGANLRHRAPRFDNRVRPEGWLAPSLRHRIETTMSWVERFRRWVPVSAISMELVRFDTQAMENPKISGIQYQQGTLAGYEVREYVLEKWGRTCAYCDAEHLPLEIEHIHPKCKGGSDRVSNLTLSCRPCNQRKGSQSIEEFLEQDPQRLKRILAQAKAPLKDAAAVNATRWRLFEALKATGLPVETGSGGHTKWNRSRLEVPKTHALDAACVGQVDRVESWERPLLSIKATGRGSYCRTRLTRHGFPRGYLMRCKRIRGFATGDLVRAVVPAGKKSGTHVGRVAVRATGKFNIQTLGGVIQGIHARHCTPLQRADGYGYSMRPSAAPQPEEERRFLIGLNAKVSAPEIG